MDAMLIEIAELLSAGGLNIEIGPELAGVDAQVWTISDALGGTDVRILVMTDDNSHPTLWVPAFASYAEKYIVPIVTRIGDARDQVVERHAVAGGNR